MSRFGVQEADIVTIVDSLTKYAVMINEPKDILYHLEKSVYLALNGRQGPVWIDIPANIQNAKIHPKKLIDYKPNVKIRKKYVRGIICKLILQK